MSAFGRVSRGVERRQRGSILPFFAIGLLGIVGVAGLAIDSSHAFVNVTRLQNALDAAALSAGKTVNSTQGDTVLATAHGADTFAQHLDGGVSSVAVSFEYSSTLVPFAAGSEPARYVRAVANGFQVPIFLARALPGVGDQFSIGSTAIAGPIPLGGGEVCDIAPLLVCAPDTTDSAGEGTLFGLPIGDDSPPRCLKQDFHNGGNGGGGPGANNNNSGGGNGNGGNGGNDNGGGGGTVPDGCEDAVAGDTTLESGNFYLSRVNCPGGNCVRDALAGGYEGCAATAGALDTEPGNTVGPTRQGLNTRFGIYSGGGVNATDHPADFVVTSPMLYADYKAQYAAEDYSSDSPQAYRRILSVPIADCAGLQNGLSTVNVLALGCFFVNQLIDQGGQNSFIFGQLIDQCEADGTPGESPSTVGGRYSTYEIVLYNDPGNPGS